MPVRKPMPPALNLGGVTKTTQPTIHRDPSLEDIQDYQENNVDSQMDKNTPQSNPLSLNGATQNNSKVPTLGSMPPLSLGTVGHSIGNNVPSLNLGGV